MKDNASVSIWSLKCQPFKTLNDEDVYSDQSSLFK